MDKQTVIEIGKVLKAELNLRDERLAALEKRELNHGKDGRDGRDGKDAVLDLDALLKVAKADDTFVELVRGKPGKDADMDAVKAYAAELVEDFVSNIELPKDGEKGQKGDRGDRGEKGDPGPKGLPGADADASTVALALYEKEDFVELVKGEKGDTGPTGPTGPAGKDALPGDVADLLEQRDEFKIALKGEKGEKGDPGADGKDGFNGEDADPEVVAKSLALDEAFRKAVKGEKGDTGPAGEDGKDGADGKDAEVDYDGIAKEVGTLIAEEVSKIPTPKDGKDGIDGKDGSDGAGIDTKAWEPGIYREGTVVSAHQGQTYRALKDTNTKPPHVDWTRIGKHGFRILGIKPKEKDFQFQDGDIYIDNGSSFIYMNGKGRMLSGRGPQGKDGRDGRDGKDGAKVIENMVNYDEKSLEILSVYDNGEIVKTDYTPLLTLLVDKTNAANEEKILNVFEQIDLKLLELGTPIKVYRGWWNVDTKYGVGDVVRSGQTFYICIEDVPVGSMDPEKWTVFGGGGGSGGSGSAGGGVSLPTNLQIPQYFTYNPATGTNGWVDARGHLAIVPQVADLNNRATLPPSMLTKGKLVVVQSTGQVFELISQPNALSNNISDWREVGSGGVKYVNRLGDLPNANSVPVPQDGQLYVARVDFEGKPYFRLVSWDTSIVGAPGETTVQPLLFQGADRIIDGAGYTALIAAGPVNPGRWYVVDVAAGITPAAGEPYAGVHLPLGTKLLDLGNVQRGKSGWTVAPPDPNFTPGLVPRLPAPQTVDDLSLTRTNGGWRFLNRESYVNPLQSDPDHPLDNRKGDFQTVTEANNKAIKVYDGSAWQTLFDETQIKGWIASLALFRGTISEDPTQHVGTITWSDLPDLTALSAAQDKGTVGRYWIWAGQDPFAVVAPVAGAAPVVGTPEIGADLGGSTLHVGDWLVIADRGNGIAGDPQEVDLRWVRIGGDLLTKSRGTNLFGLKSWAAGTWEKDSLVVRGGDVYRASTPILPGDLAPDIIPTGTPPAGIGGIPYPTISTVLSVGDDTELAAVVNQATKPAQWTAYPVTADFDPAGAVFTGAHFLNGFHLVWTGFPTLNYTGGGYTIENGWALCPDNVTGPGGAPEINVDQPMLTAINAVAQTNNWTKVALGGAIKFLGDETGLPATGRIGESFLILTSPTFGRGNPAIVTWDAAAGRFILVSGSGGTAMNMMGADPLIGVGCPIGTIVMWASTTIPSGWLELNGDAFDPLVYPELGMIFPGGAVPDFRHKFVRMWGPGRPADFTGKQWTTGRPRTPFTTDRPGNHTHFESANPSHAGVPGHSRTWTGAAEDADGQLTSPSGDHSHVITGGGDAETAPDHVTLGFIIKAKEGTARIRTP